jgi:hypothetical protein
VNAIRQLGLSRGQGVLRRLLAEVNTIDDAKHLMDVAAAAKMYAQKHHLGKEAVQHATEIEIQAEIKMGEYLKDMEKNKGGRPIEKTCTTEGQVSEPATYEEIGITRNEASSAMVDNVPSRTFFLVDFSIIWNISKTTN